MEIRNIYLLVIYVIFGFSVLYTAHFKMLELNSKYRKGYEEKLFLSKLLQHAGFLTASLLIGLGLGFFLNAVAISEDFLPIPSEYSKTVSNKEDSKTNYYTMMQYHKIIIKSFD